jgi:hypothetical protein
VTASRLSRLQHRILAWLLAEEQRTRDAMAHLKAQGKRYCHTVYDNPEWIALMHRLRAEGHSYERIAQHLHTIGLPTALGDPWQAMVVYGIVWRTQPPVRGGLHESRRAALFG